MFFFICTFLYFSVFKCLFSWFNVPICDLLLLIFRAYCLPTLAFSFAFFHSSDNNFWNYFSHFLFDFNVNHGAPSSSGALRWLPYVPSGKEGTALICTYGNQQHFISFSWNDLSIDVENFHNFFKTYFQYFTLSRHFDW